MDVKQKSAFERFKGGLANFALVVASIGITYLVGEFVFFRYALPHMSLNLRPHLPDRADFFLQNSKAAYVPHDYIALLGDSNAQGVGDWLLSVGGKNDRPYHSANVIRDLVGKDVVTLGRTAAGSAEAFVLRVTRILRDTHCYVFPTIEQPNRFFFYFTEGNDFYDNIDFLWRQVKAETGDLRSSVDGALDRDYGAISQWRCHGHLGDVIFRMTRFLVRDYFREHYLIDLPPTKNKVLIAGAATGTAELLIPPLNLSDRQIEDAVIVYERSLAWLRRHYPDIPITVVYIPSPAANYRHAGSEVIAKDVYLLDQSEKLGKEVRVDGPSFPVAKVYEYSRRLCEKIREVSLRGGASFIDARPPLREQGARVPLHGPRDWNHPNEAGYRLIGAIVAKHIDDRPDAACDDSWPTLSTRVQ